MLEPRVHLVPGGGVDGHFNVLRGVVHPLGLAGVKVVGDFVDNYRRGLPSELAPCSTCSTPRPACRVAIVDATGITEMRTGAVTALGARHLARRGRPRARAHRQPRHRRTGTCACWRACSTWSGSACTRGGPRAARPSPPGCDAELDAEVVAVDDWESLRARRGRRRRGQRGCARRSRCCGRRGSRPARWWCPTAR